MKKNISLIMLLVVFCLLFSIDNNKNFSEVKVKNNHYFTFDNSLSAEDYLFEENNITNIPLHKSRTEFLKSFSVSEGGELKLNCKKESNYVGTGCNLTVYNEGIEQAVYNTVVTGDLNGDGKVTLSDAVLLFAYNSDTDDDTIRRASDINNDDAINTSDISALADYVLLKKELPSYSPTVDDSSSDLDDEKESTSDSTDSSGTSSSESSSTGTTGGTTSDPSSGSSSSGSSSTGTTGGTTSGSSSSSSSSSSTGTTNAAKDVIMDIPKISQGASAYYSYRFPVHTGSSLPATGCGIVSTTMIIQYLTGNKNITVQQVATWADNNGHYNGRGSNGTIFNAAAKKWGVGSATEIGASLSATDSATKAKRAKNLKKVVAALRNRQPVVSYQYAGIFTKGEHFIVLSGITKEGKIYVNNPSNGTKKLYTQAQVNAKSRSYFIFSASK